MTCDLCKQDKPDALKRMSPKGSRPRDWKNLDLDPVLCRDCCATFPGHQWLAQSDPDLFSEVTGYGAKR